MSATYPQVHDPINQTTRIEDAISYDGLKPVIHNVEENINNSRSKLKSKTKSRSKGLPNTMASGNTEADEYHYHSSSDTPKEQESRSLLQTMLDGVINLANSSTKYVMERGHSTYIALQNPVVLVNTLIGATSIYAVLNKYANLESRFLADKSNRYIWTTVVAGAGLLSLDVVLSKKYYVKFQKKLDSK